MEAAMAKGVEEYLQRFASDAAFRDQLETDFDAAVSEYDLTDDEKRELRDYLQSDRHRAIQGHAAGVFEEMLYKATGGHSPDEQRLIEERERRNLQAMLPHADEEAPPERAPLADRPEKSCVMCGEPQPSFAWFKGWRNGLCPAHRNTTAVEMMLKLEQDMEETKRWMRDRGL
jgi:hypothetical protein